MKALGMQQFEYILRKLGDRDLHAPIEVGVLDVDEVNVG